MPKVAHGGYLDTYCNFGGLNNLSPADIGHLAHELSELIYPGGKVVLVVMGRFCLFETLYYLWKCNFKRAFRRLKRSQNTGTAARVAPNTKNKEANCLHLFTRFHGEDIY